MANEDLGNGMSAVFTMEMGLDPGNGVSNQGGRLFGRQAYVGLKSGMGTVTVGRIYSMTFWSGLNADIHGGGIYGTGSLDSYLPNARVDNALGYMYSQSGLTLGATYSLGRDAVNAGPSPAGTNCPGESSDSRACRQWSLMAKYDTPTWGAAVFVDTGSAFDDQPDWRTGVGIGARWKSPVGPVRIDIARGLNQPDSPFQLYIGLGADL